MYNLFFTIFNIVFFIILLLLIISLNIKPCSDWNGINSFALWLSALGMVTISAITLWLTLKDKLIRIVSEFNIGVIPECFLIVF